MDHAPVQPSIRVLGDEAKRRISEQAIILKLSLYTKIGEGIRMPQAQYREGGKIRHETDGIMSKLREHAERRRLRELTACRKHSIEKEEK